MIKRLWGVIAKIANVWVFLALLVIYIVCSQAFNDFRDQYAPARGFDARGFYRPSCAPVILAKFGSHLDVYLRQESTLDLAFPVVYSLLFAVGIVWLGKKTAVPRWLIVLPFAAALFDYCENLAVINMIRSYRRTGKVPVALEWVASIATPVKTVLFIGSAMLVIVLAVISVARAVQRWRKSEDEEEVVSAGGKTTAADLAKHYRDQFAANTAKTGTTLVAWGAALTVLLVQPMLSIETKLHSYEKDVEREYRNELRLQSVANDSGRRKLDPQEWLKTRFELGESHSERVDIQKSKLKSLQELQKVKTPLGELELPTSYVPPLFSLLVAGFVVYLMRRRLVLHAMVVKVLHLNLHVLQKPAEEISGFGAWSPFWLAPLPPITRRDAAASELVVAARRDFLGWRRTEEQRTFLFALLLAAAGGAWMWAITMAYRLERVDTVRPPVGLRWETHTLLFAAVAVFCVFYIRPVVAWGEFPERLVIDNPRRRDFLGLSAVAAAAFVGASMLPRSLLVHVPWLRSPRYRRTRPAAVLREVGFFRNASSKIVHYIAPNGRVVGGLPLGARVIRTFKGDVARMARSASRNIPAILAASKNAVNVQSKQVASDLKAREALLTDAVPPPGMPVAVVEPSADYRPPRLPKPHLPKPRLSQHASPFALEMLAVAAARQGHLAPAIELVWSAILADTVNAFTSGRPGYRLYELYCGLLHRSGASLTLRLTSHVHEYWPNDMRLAAILAKARQPSARWSKRWHSQPLPWRTSLEPRRQPMFTRLLHRFHCGRERTNRRV